MIVADLAAILRLRPDKKSFDAGKRLLSGIKTAIGAFVAFQGIKFAAGLVKDTIALGDEIDTVAEKLGITTTALQELRYAADLSDASAQDLENGLRFLGKNALEASEGSQAMRDNFRKLGVSVKGTDGKLRKTDDILLDLADSFQKIPEAERAARAMQVLGKSGANLVPFLNKGREGIAALRQEARSFGGILSDEDIKRASRLDDAFKRIKAQGSGLLKVFALGFFPVIEDIVLVVGKWLKNNKDLIKGGLITFVNGVITVIGVLIDQVIKIRDAFRHLTEEGADFGMVARGAFAAILFVIKAIGTAIEFAIVAIAAWGEAIGTAIGAAVVFFVNLWDTLKAGFNAVVDFITGIFTTFFDWINGKINALLDRFRDIRDAPGAFLDFITGDVESEAVQNMAQRDRERAARFAAMRAANAQNATRPAGAPGQSVSTNTMNANITVNAPQADPKAVAVEVQRQLDETWRTAEPALQ